MRVEVMYDVPVSVFVDLEQGAVEAVHVWDEGIEQREGDCSIVALEAETPIGDPDRERTQEIVDSVVWPAWNLG